MEEVGGSSLSASTNNVETISDITKNPLRFAGDFFVVSHDRHL